MARRLIFKDPRQERRLILGRLAMTVLCMLLGLGMLLYRYHDLQIVQHEVYRTGSERNRVQLRPVAPKRGLIFDRNGVLLAGNMPSYSLTVVIAQAWGLEAALDSIGEVAAL